MNERSSEVLAATAAPAPVRHNTGLGAALRHARYILGENAVTGFAFGMFLLIVIAAAVASYLMRPGA